MVATTRTLYLSRSAAARTRRAGAWRFVVVPPSRARRRTPTGDGPSRARRACDLTKKIYIYKYGSRERLPRRSAVSRSRHNWSAVAVTPCGRVDRGSKSLALFLCLLVSSNSTVQLYFSTKYSNRTAHCYFYVDTYLLISAY